MYNRLQIYDICNLLFFEEVLYDLEWFERKKY